VLVTENPIKVEILGAPEHAWLEWVNWNLEFLCKEYKSELTKYGLWIVTKIYSTKTACISVLSNSKTESEIGMSVEAGGILKFDPHWTASHEAKSSGWMKYESTVSLCFSKAGSRS
jgi:hypothetical protein